jgi:hypothetical protein
VTQSQRITLRQLNRATLARQMLLSRERLTVPAAVARLVAMQAQLARPPFVGLWTRLDPFAREDLTRALQAREIVRATSFRGTIHLMTAADFVAFRGAIQPMLTRGMTGILRGRLDGVDVEKVVAIGREFFGKAPSTFDSFRKHLERKYPKGDHRAMAYVVRMQVPLVQVPTDVPWGFSAAADFALAGEGTEVAGKGPGKGTEVGVIKPTSVPFLLKRYLAAYGPASVADAQAFTGLQKLQPAFDELRSELVTFKDARKRELFDLPDAPRPDEDTPAPIRYLPDFDSLLLAHADRSRVIADEHRALVVSKNLQIAAVFLVDGVAAGIWKVARNRKTAVLALQSFSSLTKKIQAALEAEGDALLRFVEPDAAERVIKWVNKV